MSHWKEWDPSEEKKVVEWKDKTWVTPLGLVSFGTAVPDNKSADFYKQRLFEAAKNGDNLEIQRLLKEHKVDANARHYLGWTPLHVAARNGHSSTVELLIESGADPNLADEYTTYSEMAGAKVVDKGLKYSLQASLAVKMTREDAFPDKLDNFQEDRNKDRKERIDDWEDEWYDWGAKQTEHTHFKGHTALHYAVMSGDLKSVEMLLENGANPLAKSSRKGYLPKHYANGKPMKDLLDEYKSMKIFKKKKGKEGCRISLETRIKEAIVGQEVAITTVTSAIRRKESGWCDDEHPLVFLFLGSSGIGKTELAKQIAKYLYKDMKEAFIRIDMSEYHEKHNVARFIGSPPGYYGCEKGGQLTQSLEKFPNAVVLFDEVEKAHPDVLHVLLQLFDEGRITDGRGKTIECKEAIFVMTSNLASEEIAEYVLQFRGESDTPKEGPNGKNDERIVISSQFKENVVRPILKRHFKRDEFLGRINEIVYFLPFSKSEVGELITVELKSWAEKAKKKHKIDLKWDDGVLEALSLGYNVHYGARSLKHEVERRVLNQLAVAHGNEQLLPNSTVQIIAETDPDQSGEINIALKITTDGDKNDDDDDEDDWR